MTENKVKKIFRNDSFKNSKFEVSIPTLEEAVGFCRNLAIEFHAKDSNFVESRSFRSHGVITYQLVEIIDGERKIIGNRNFYSLAHLENNLNLPNRAKEIVYLGDGIILKKYHGKGLGQKFYQESIDYYVNEHLQVVEKPLIFGDTNNPAVLGIFRSLDKQLGWNTGSLNPTNNLMWTFAKKYPNNLKKESDLTNNDGWFIVPLLDQNYENQQSSVYLKFWDNELAYFVIRESGLSPNENLNNTHSVVFVNPDFDSSKIGKVFDEVYPIIGKDIYPYIHQIKNKNIFPFSQGDLSNLINATTIGANGTLTKPYKFGYFAMTQ